jgi:hypothetical protein
MKDWNKLSREEQKLAIQIALESPVEVIIKRVPSPDGPSWRATLRYHDGHVLSSAEPSYYKAAMWAANTDRESIPTLKDVLGAAYGVPGTPATLVWNYGKKQQPVDAKCDFCGCEDESHTERDCGKFLTERFEDLLNKQTRSALDEVELTDIKRKLWILENQ